MPEGNPDGPAWLMIGAQRAGTTWFTGLLTQHPEISVVNGAHDTPGITPTLITGRGDGFAERYLTRFRGADGKPGECAAAYLRCGWVPRIARQLSTPDVVLVALLRDPVDRFASAMRMKLSRADLPGNDGPAELHRWSRLHGTDAQWGGMYAAQLDAWSSAFDRRHLVVMQYEWAASNPEEAVGRVWSALGVDPVALDGIDTPSATSTNQDETWSWDLLPGFRDTLTELYAPEVERLEREWSIESGLWPSYAGRLAP